MWLMLLSAVITLILLYLYWSSSLTRWKRLNVPHVTPHFFWGNLKDVFYLRQTFFELYQKIYRQFPDAPYVGIYIVNRPGLLIRDPNLVKEVVVNNFSSFHDNDLMVDESVDPIFGQNPFTTAGSKWKVRRTAHTPQFSSGKIKYMFTLMTHSGDKMVKFLNDQIGKSGKYTIEAMELAAKYTIENVANCSMGIDARTFAEDNSEMRDMGRKIMEPNFYNGMKQLLIFILPKLSNFLTVRLVPTEVTNKFRRMVRETLQYRKEHSIVLNDFFEDIQTHKGEKCSVDDMIAQIGGLFLDGFATNSTALNFITYELAVNPDAQARLREEVDETLEKHNGQIPYETFQEMPYLDAFISEGLRKYPPLASLTKVCTKSFTLPPVNDAAKPLTIPEGMPVVIPLFGLHYDEKYFPDPERFDPTRFYGENKERHEKFTYLPFNEGPRTCLGKRFALVQSKMMLLKLVSKFEIRLNPKTKTPIQYDVQSFLMAAKGGIWIDIYKRKN